MRQFLRTTIFILVVIFGIQNGWSQPQPGDRIDQLERQLHRLQEKIQQARRFAGLFPNPQLRDIIRAAERQYQLAQQAFQQKRYFQARDHLKLGFTILGRLYRVIRNTPYLRNKFKEKLDQKIREAEQIVNQSANPEARKLLNRSRYFRQRAFQLAVSDRPEVALRHYFLALFFAENAIRIATGQDQKVIHNLERHFEDSQSLLQQAKEMAAGQADSRVQNLLQRSERELKMARQLYAEQHPRRAFQKLQIANRLLYRLLDLLENTPASLAQRLERDLEILQNSIDEVGREVQEQELPEMRGLYQRLVFLASSARQKYQNGQLTQARNQASIANRLLYQLHRRLRAAAPLSTQQLEDQVRTAETMLSALKENAPDAEYYHKMLNILESNLNMIKNALQQNQPAEALQRLKFFNRLALTLDHLKSAEDLREENVALVEKNLDRLKEMVDTSPVETESDPLMIIKYEQAQKLYEIANSAFQQKNYAMCGQITRMAIQLITE